MTAAIPRVRAAFGEKYRYLLVVGTEEHKSRFRFSPPVGGTNRYVESGKVQPRAIDVIDPSAMNTILELSTLGMNISVL